MLTPDDFRRIALGMTGAMESSHMDHPDFRVNGKIFATLSYPTEAWGTVMLTPEQQREFVVADPEIFTPVSGGWGLKGATSVRLASATEDAVHQAVTAAWGNKQKPAARRTRARHS